MSLRILQVSTSDIHGGAEKVAWDLFTSYRARGHRSWLAVGQKRSNDPDVLQIPNQERRGRGYHFFQRIASRLQQVNGKRSPVPRSDGCPASCPNQLGGSIFTLELKIFTSRVPHVC
jgi:hypothetical protein